MQLEHFALQVPEPVAAANWYVAHLGFTITRGGDREPWMHFLTTSDGRVMIEIYRNPAASVPDYPSMDPLLVHLAFQVDDLPAEWDRLLAAGATVATPAVETPTGDVVAMLRDPWGVPIQLVKRAEVMLPPSD